MGVGKKQTIGYRYYAWMHTVLCRGPIDDIDRLRVGEKETFIETVNGVRTVKSEELFGGDEEEGGVSGEIEYLFGGPTQAVNNDLVEAIGDGDLPAYRGVTSVLYKDFYFGNSKYLKNHDFRATRIHTRQDGDDQWYDEKAEIAGPFVSVRPGSGRFRDEFLGNSIDTSIWDNPGGYEVEDDGTDTYVKIRGDKPLRFHRPLALGDSISGTYSEFHMEMRFIDSGSVTIVFKDSVRTYSGTFQASSTEWVETFSADKVEGADIDYNWWINQTTSDGSIFDGTWDGLRLAFEYNSGLGDYESTLTVPSGTIQANPAANTPSLFGGAAYIEIIPNEVDGVNLDVRFVSFGPTSTNANTLYDMNPAHIIRECLTDPSWGLGYPEYDIDDTAFMSAADTLYDEGMGISLLWNNEISTEDFIHDILRHIDGVLYLDRQTGLFVLSLIRDDYDESTLPILGDDEINKVEEYQLKNRETAVNSVTVRYDSNTTDQIDSITVDNSAMVAEAGVRIGETMDFMGFSNADTAAIAAQRELNQLTSELVSAIIYTDRSGASLNVGDPFKFVSAEHHSGYIVMRVTKIEFGDSRSNMVKITATQDVFSQPASSYVVDERSGFQSVLAAPLPIEKFKFTELPYYEMVQLFGETDTDARIADNNDIGFLAVAAGKNFDSDIDYKIRIKQDAANIEDGEFSPYGLLSADMGYADTSVYIDNSFDVNTVETATHALIDDEIVRVDSLTADSNGYTVTVGRGCLDTVPTTHAAGKPMFFWDETVSTNNTDYSASDSIDVYLIPRGTGGSVNAEAVDDNNVTFNSRAYRPYPPGRLTIDSNFYPEVVPYSDPIVIRWAHRDRQEQTADTILDTTDIDVGPEVGTTYNLRVYHYPLDDGTRDSNAETQIVNETGLTGHRYELSPPASYEGYYLVELESVRSGYKSWQTHEFMFLIELDSLLATDSTVINLRFEGPDASTTFEDSGPNNFTVNSNGTAQIDTAQFKFGSSSGLFDGSGDISVDDDPAFNLSGEDWTIECWVRFNTLTGNQHILSKYTTSSNAPFAFFHVGGSSTVGLYLSSNGTGWDIANGVNIATGISAGVWYHLAVVRDGDDFRTYQDGSLVSSFTSSSNLVTNTEPFQVGKGTDGNPTRFNGWVDDLRIMKGEALFNSNFTPEDTST